MRCALRAVLAGVVIVLAVGLAPHAAEAADIGELDAATIVVRTYTPSRLGSEIRSSRRTVAAIFGRAHIQIDWLECGPTGSKSSAAACGQPLQSNELVVRIVSAKALVSRPDADTLGFAFVDLDAGGGSLATVYGDRVQVMARSAGVGFAELLGRTMAHEIGHLLLGTSGHAPQGLMRPSWSSTDLRQHRDSQWLFGGNEGEVMRKGIADRWRFVPLITVTQRDTERSGPGAITASAP